MIRLRPTSTLFPYTTLFRSLLAKPHQHGVDVGLLVDAVALHFEQEAVLAEDVAVCGDRLARHLRRSEEHTSELQSHSDLVCRLLLDKKKRQDAFHLIPVHTS